ncbi:MAG TPA: pentapeptide repeat-containing protein [Mycobacterium sp.]|nr:pentapeptide repeat-containing protein [Mycobacterium sp.]
MPERLADAIDELAQPNRPQRPEPQIQADPALRRPRLLRNAPQLLVAVLVFAVAGIAGWATFWALGISAVSDRLGPLSDRLAIRAAAGVVVGVVVGGLVAWAFRPIQTLRGAARSRLVTWRRRTARIPLFASVAAAVLIGLILSALATRAISGAFVMDAGAATAVDVLKAALPAIAGIVVAVGLVVVYRRQKGSERREFEHRFGAATVQLGGSDVAVRVAGVYALAAVADESPAFARRQQCIDMLCGYLRLPFDPDSGDNHVTEFVSTTTWSATPPATHIEEQRRQAIRQNDRVVRNTIIRVIGRHLRSNADTSWSGNDFDFTGVLLEEASLDGVTFSGRHVSFERATFRTQTTSFDGAAFNAENVSFGGAKFESETTFTGATFRARRTSFAGATFAGTNISFDGTRFTGEHVSFDRASFAAERTTFLSAKFKCLRASFDSPAEWKDVEFDWDTEHVAGDSLPTIPRCIAPRPWPPDLTGEE